jgi:hypothetical protein
VLTRRLLVANGITGSLVSSRSSGVGAPTLSTSPSSDGERSSRPTGVGGTTTRPTTKTITRSGVSPVAAAIASCSPPGTRSLADRTTSSPTSLQLWSSLRLA